MEGDHETACSLMIVMGGLRAGEVELQRVLSWTSMETSNSGGGIDVSAEGRRGYPLIIPGHDAMCE